MSRGLLLLALLAHAAADGVALPEQTRAGMLARLMVHVDDPGPQPGAAHLTLTITGGLLLQVEAPRLSDPVNAWEAQQNEWQQLDGDRLTWTKAILLRKVKPGLAGLPDVKVRFREGSGASWEEAEWVDVLKTPADGPPPEPLPLVPNGMGWLPWVIPAAALTLALAWFLQRRRPRLRATLPPDKQALLELRRLEQSADLPSAAYHTALSDVIRTYLAERLGLPATRQTTAEFLEMVRRTGRLSPEEQRMLHAFLERCDLAKFAPVGVSAEECREAAVLARGLVERTAGPSARRAAEINLPSPLGGGGLGVRGSALENQNPSPPTPLP